MRKYVTLTLQGDHYTMGRQHGLQVRELRPLIAKAIKARFDQKHLPLQIVIHATPESGYRYVYSGSAGSPGVFCAGINQYDSFSVKGHHPAGPIGSVTRWEQY